MGGKNHLTLYIDTELRELAKASDLNLSAEFEEWVKTRLNQSYIDEPVVNVDLEIARYRAEIMKLENKKEMQNQQISREKDEIMILDGVIDNAREMTKMNHPETTWESIADGRMRGVQFLFKQKFKRMLNPLEAKEMLLKRIKERELDG